MEQAGNFLYNGYKKVRDFVEGSAIEAYQKGFSITGFMDEDITTELEELDEVVDNQPSNAEVDSTFSYKNRQLLQKLLSDFVSSFEAANKISMLKKLQYGLAYLIIQSNFRLTNWVIPYKNPASETDRKLERLAYFSKFAVGIYGPDELYESTIDEQKSLLFNKGTDREQFLFWSNTTEDELIECFFENKHCCPVHAVCLDRASKSVVVAIRGTSCLEDIITDLHLTYEEFELTLGDKTFRGNVHSGMMSSAKNISERIKQIVLDALERNPDYTLVITGHSLGAGTSAMLCLLWKADLRAIERGMEVYCYSPPATNSASLNKILKKNVLSCSFGHDVVAKASMGTASDLAEMMIFMDEAERNNKLNTRHILTSYLTSSEITLENVEIYKQIKEFVAGGFYERLVPPGKMFQIFKKGLHEEFEHAAKLPSATLLEDSIAGVFIDSSYHQEIIFSPTLAADHSCINLQYTLQRMWGIKHTLDFHDT